MALVFVDTETTGLGDCRLIELCYSLHGAVTTLRCKPPIPIELEAQAVHHITPEDVEDLLPFMERPDYQAIKAVLESNTVVAHHAVFDVGVLAREGIVISDYLCSKELAKKRWPEAKSHSLQYLRHYLGIRLPGAVSHSASGDVAVLEHMWRRMHE